MMLVAFAALLANGFCLYLLRGSKNEEAHMRASEIFTSNDIVVNLGVIAAGGLVYALDSRIPDLVVGAIVFLVVLHGAGRILKLSK
ncbi:MAG: cation transporter [Candidatus Omnitrophica bacterium]|nr:cation transporter [Candidatus Omnitrophota bacterium]